MKQFVSLDGFHDLGGVRVDFAVQKLLARLVLHRDVTLRVVEDVWRCLVALPSRRHPS